MEKRAFIAIIVSFAIIYLFQAVFFKPHPPSPAPAPGPAEATPVRVEASKPVQEPMTAPPDLSAATSEFKIRVETKLYKAVFTNRGARLLSFKLKNYTDSEGKQLELVPQGATQADRLPLGVESRDPSLAKQVNGGLFSADRDSIELLGDGGMGSVTTLLRLPSGEWISKRFEFYPYSYDVKVALAASPGLGDLTVILSHGLGNLSLDQQKSASFTSRVIYEQGGKIERIDKKEGVELGAVKWLGVEDKYFVMLARFDTALPAAISAPDDRIGKAPAALIRGVPRGPFLVFIGPKDYTLLKQLGSGMERVIDYGVFGFLAKGFLRVMKTLYAYIPNYGVAIIILTIAIKILLFPLTYRSTISMLKMQKLQPEMQAIRERYAKKKSIEDRQQMNTEVMKLYKERGVNPMGGCLPLLLQIPFFYAFYSLLSTSIEMRGAPFVLWIHDLSVRDPYYIIPLLMGVTQLIVTRMTPSPADPVQAKMMMIMPVVFTLFFLNLQSGLVLYWTVNNVLQILQQYVMGRMGIVPTRSTARKK